MFPNLTSILSHSCRLDPAQLTIVGVSGGPDSLCLMDVLRRAGYPLLVAHFNHKLRDSSDSEAGMVESLAERFGLPSVVESGDVNAFADQQRLSTEEAARTLRYRFLFRVARQRGAQAVAVGHTADDQVETVLMHFLRGAGLNGLKGMPYRVVIQQFDADIPLVRPLLDSWREATVAYCAGQGLHPLYDPSNESDDYLRNRLRHNLIPGLESYNPKFREAVRRSARTLSADYDVIQRTVEDAWKHAVLSSTESLVIFDLAALSGMPDGLMHHLVRRAVEFILPSADVTYAMLDRAVEYLHGQDSVGMIPLGGGIRLLREADQVFFAGEQAVLPFERWPQLPAGQDSIPFSLPAVFELPGGWRFSAEVWNLAALAREHMQNNEDPFQVWLDAESLQGGFSLRIRQEGDRFEPLGMEGHSQKLSDFFTNIKLPQRARERYPLLCAGETIAWIPGHHPAHQFRLTNASRRIIYFALHPPSINMETPATQQS